MVLLIYSSLCSTGLAYISVVTWWGSSGLASHMSGCQLVWWVTGPCVSHHPAFQSSLFSWVRQESLERKEFICQDLLRSSLRNGTPSHFTFYWLQQVKDQPRFKVWENRLHLLIEMDTRFREEQWLAVSFVVYHSLSSSHKYFSQVSVPFRTSTNIWWLTSCLDAAAYNPQPVNI